MNVELDQTVNDSVYIRAVLVDVSADLRKVTTLA